MYVFSRAAINIAHESYVRESLSPEWQPEAVERVGGVISYTSIPTWNSYSSKEVHLLQMHLSQFEN